MRLSKFFAAAALGGLLVGGLIAPASAHTRTFQQVYATTWEDGTVHTQAWLSPEQHSGTMKTTLKKRNLEGVWVNIATKTATFQLGWGYTVNFAPVAGNKRCKAVARHTAVNHATISKASPVFDC